LQGLEPDTEYHIAVCTEETIGLKGYKEITVRTEAE
jgi:hypothetical protein